ncbi:hypothetical protein PG993_003660 [Apiospora rasikravindrae]|uniref:F-box domain-containing protein n=1 Tax=Apiospora rasikravindrae TaxID=990691 RepID=A0ABR1U046_9PEZI
MTSRSQDKVFGTTELLECILVHVDLATLLASVQLVHRRWHDFNRDSPALQRHLFFRGISQPTTKGPAAVAAALKEPSRSTHDPEVNPLLKAKFPLFFYELPAGADSEWLIPRAIEGRPRARYKAMAGLESRADVINPAPKTLTPSTPSLVPLFCPIYHHLCRPPISSALICSLWTSSIRLIW